MKDLKPISKADEPSTDWRKINDAILATIELDKRTSDLSAELERVKRLLGDGTSETLDARWS